MTRAARPRHQCRALGAALAWPPYRLFQTVRPHDGAQLFTSVALLAELADVLIRPFATKRLALIGASAREILDAYVLATAVAAQADLVVSGDRHLLGLTSHAGIRIVGPADAIRLIASG